jgi:hypothetical protein
MRRNAPLCSPVGSCLFSLPITSSGGGFILYLSSDGFLSSLIAAGYFSMLVGDAVPYVLQVEKMKSKASMLLAPIVFLLSAAIACGQENVKNPQQVHPGDTITITSPTLADGDKVTVTLKPVSEAAGVIPPCADNPPALVPQPVGIQGPGQTAISLGVPLDACLGIYQISGTKQNDKSSSQTSPMQISSPLYVQIARKKPEVTTLYPKALFSNSAQEGTNANTRGKVPHYALTFLGPPPLLPKTPICEKQLCTYSLRFSDRALPLCDQNPPDGKSCYQQDVEGSQAGAVRFILQGNNFLKDFAGARKVSLADQGAESDPLDMIVVNASTTTPRNFAIGITLSLVVLIYILLSAARKAIGVRTGRSTFLLSALFLDEQTQTYSLSKCQFYAWTIAGVLGYVFFAVARSVVQGSAVFPDIPGGLPGILLVSAGTSVLATGITSSKGSKGAGEVHPTLGDFITTGGVVAPERLQFVVWTVVGVFTFLTIVFKSDPLTLSDLPTIPNGFLELMGISSAGYLGGKLARKPGPVIKMPVSVVDVTDMSPTNAQLPAQYQPTDASVTPSGYVLTINIKGENLDPKAKIKIKGEPLRADQFWITGANPDPQTGFCTELNVSVNSATEYVENPTTVTLTLVNTDGQAADATFPTDPMSIDTVAPLPAAPAPDPAAVAVTGKNFVANTTAQWQPPGVGAAPVDAAPVTYTNATQLTISRPQNVVAGYTLILTSPVGLRASLENKTAAASGFSITSTSLPGATVGTPYQQTLQANGGAVPLHWSVAPPLPTTLALDNTTGVISGTPTAVAPMTKYTFTVTDSATTPASVSSDINLEIKAAAAPAFNITSTSLPDATVGTSYQQTLQANGGAVPLHWSVAPPLPAPLALDNTTGVISGTPTAAAPMTKYTFTVTDSATAPASASSDITLEIKATAGNLAIPIPDSDDIDGCDLPVEKSTLDEDLPAAEGGVA